MFISLNTGCVINRSDYDKIIFVLDWTGGQRRNMSIVRKYMPRMIVDKTNIQPANLSRLYYHDFTKDPSVAYSLAADENKFKENVRILVGDILRNGIGNIGPFEVVNGESYVYWPQATVVWVTYSDIHRVKTLSYFGTPLGEGNIDRGNLRIDDEAFVYVRGMLWTKNPRFMTWNKWVILFSDVIGHEIGHTLGFRHSDHICRDSIAGYYDIMMSNDMMWESDFSRTFRLEQNTNSFIGIVTGKGIDYNVKYPIKRPRAKDPLDLLNLLILKQ